MSAPERELRSARAYAHAILLVVFVVSTVGSGVRAYLALAQNAASLRHLSMEERRRTLFAPWYGEVVALRDAVPANASIDMVMIVPGARDVAVLAGPLLQPRDVRYFDGWTAWRHRTRARFLHDERAANAVSNRPLPGRAHMTVAVDPTTTPIFKVVR